MPYYPPAAAVLSGVFHACYLAPSGGNLVLSRYGGTLLTIGDMPQTIPAGGVSLGTGGLSLGAVYYIYAYMNAGVMTLSAEVGAPTQWSVNGMQVHSGNANFTLVGKAFVATGPTFTDLTNMIGVISYYNRKPKTAIGIQTATYSTGSTSWTELSPDMRAFFLSWDDDVAICSLDGRHSSDIAAGVTITGIGFNGAGTRLEGHNLYQPAVAGGYAAPFAIATHLKCSSISALTLPYTSLIGYTANGLASWVLSGAAAGSRAANRVSIMG